MNRQSIYNKFHSSDRDFKAIRIAIIILLIIIVEYACVLIYEHDSTELKLLLQPVTSILASLLVAAAASRLLDYNKWTRAEDRSHDIVRVTHHAMAITNDLRERIKYLEKCLTEGNQSVIIEKNAKDIERRYETFYDRELYKYLPGETIQEITNLSAPIFVISALLSQPSIEMNKNDPKKYQKSFSDIQSQLDSLYSKLEKIRTSAE